MGEYTREQFLKNQAIVEKAQAWCYLRDTRYLSFRKLCGDGFYSVFHRSYKFFVWVFFLIETLNDWYVLLRKFIKNVRVFRLRPSYSLKQSAMGENETVNGFDVVFHEDSLVEKSNVDIWTPPVRKELREIRKLSGCTNISGL